MQAAEAFEGDLVGETPSLDGSRVAVGHFTCLAVDSGTTGTIEAMPLWAGESVNSVKHLRPAAEIVRVVASAAEDLLRLW